MTYPSLCQIPSGFFPSIRWVSKRFRNDCSMSIRTGKGKKRKPKVKPDNPAQSARFIQAAKKLGLDESGKDFDKAMDKLLPKPKRGSS